jgi:hypothetical protein
MNVRAQPLFPRFESMVPGYGVRRKNCANATSARSATSAVAKRGWAVARQPEDERAEGEHAVLAELAQALDECLAGLVEALGMEPVTSRGISDIVTSSVGAGLLERSEAGRTSQGVGIFVQGRM